MIWALALPVVAGIEPTLFWGGLLLLAGTAGAFAVESATREIDEDTAAVQESMLERLRSGVGAAADRRLMRSGAAKSIRIKLEVVGANMKPVEFVAVVGGVAVVAAIAGFLYLGPVGLLVGFGLPQVIALVVLDRKVKKQRASFAEQLPEMLQLLGGSLKAGMSFSQSLSAVGHESPPSASNEIRKVLTENRLGRSFVESLSEVAVRMESKDFEWVVAAVEVHEEVGGNLADVLDRVAATIRARDRVKGQVKALSAEGRMSGHVMSALPPGIFAILYVANPDYAGVLFSDPLGHKLLGVAGVLLFVGSITLRKMAQFKF